MSALDADGAPLQRDDNAGLYAIVESPALFEGDDGRAVRLFVRAGVAEERINPVRSYLGAGIVRSAVFSGDDQLGLAVALATLGNPYRDALAAAGEGSVRRESNVELSYRVAITDWLTLQPDVQFVHHPGMSPECARCVGDRVEVRARRGLGALGAAKSASATFRLSAYQPFRDWRAIDSADSRMSSMRSDCCTWAGRPTA